MVTYNLLLLQFKPVILLLISLKILQMRGKNFLLVFAILGACLIISILLVAVVLLTTNTINQSKQIEELKTQLDSLNLSQDTSMPTEVEENTWSVTTKSDIEETANYSISILYPTFSHPQHSDIALDLNNYVSQSILQYKKDTMFTDNISSSKSTLDLDYDIKFLNNNLISLLISGSQYSGGAHPSGVYISVNYDLKNNKALELQDLFNPASGYLNSLSINTKAALLEKFGANADESFIEGGTSAEINNFKIFNISDGRLIITFPEYQVAPYAVGSQQVELNLDDYSSMFRSEFSALL